MRGLLHSWTYRSIRYVVLAFLSRYFVGQQVTILDQGSPTFTGKISTVIEDADSSGTPFLCGISLGPADRGVFFDKHRIPLSELRYDLVRKHWVWRR